MNIALVGLGEIALSHHIPAISSNDEWTLAATVSRSTQIDGIPNFSKIEELLGSRPDVSVLSLCMPPLPRFDIARAAIASGRHVMLEKPPGSSVSECYALAQLAKQANVSLFATWHSREAEMLSHCQRWLADKEIKSFELIWKEDVRRWHPGQEWLWMAGGMGVFDPGINALSILTEILPDSVHMKKAHLEIPANKQTPIAAQLQLSTSGGAQGRAHFDWRQPEPQIWDIEVRTNNGVLQLSDGGARFSIDGQLRHSSSCIDSLAFEYPRLYQKMSALVKGRQCDCDFSPLQLVSDAFMLATHNEVEAFEW